MATIAVWHVPMMIHRWSAGPNFKHAIPITFGFKVSALAVGPAAPQEQNTSRRTQTEVSVQFAAAVGNSPRSATMATALALRSPATRTSRRALGAWQCGARSLGRTVCPVLE